MSKITLYIAWITSLIAAIGSLFLSNVFHWVPCVLCWYQRTMMFPLAIVLGIGILVEVTNLEYIVLSLASIGAVIAIYHNLLQYGVIPEHFSACVNGVSCTTSYHLFFNFLTVPLLSLISFVVIIICMVLYRQHRRLSSSN